MIPLIGGIGGGIVGSDAGSIGEGGREGAGAENGAAGVGGPADREEALPGAGSPIIPEVLPMGDMPGCGGVCGIVIPVTASRAARAPITAASSWICACCCCDCAIGDRCLNVAVGIGVPYP